MFVLGQNLEKNPQTVLAGFSHNVWCVFVVLFYRAEAETRMLEAKECIEVETAQFTKRQMQLKTVIDHDAKLQTFMERKLQEMIPLEDNEDSKNRSMIPAHQRIVS